MKKPITYLLLIPYIFLLTACVIPSSSEKAARATQLAAVESYATRSVQTCKLNLKTFIRQGPNQNKTIIGLVDFEETGENNFRWNLLEETGTSHQISLHLDGPAISFILDTELGQIYGSGMMEESQATCKGKGGGTLSGPTLGDMGDWRGEWFQSEKTIQEELPQPAPVARDENLSAWNAADIILIASITTLGLIILFVRWQGLNRKYKSKPSTTSLRRARTADSVAPNGEKLPIAEYHATYTADDKLFDLSFDVEKAGNYLGECGISVAKVTSTPANQASAFEFWLFDAKNPQDARANITKVLMSEFCYSQAKLRDALETKGQAVLVQPGSLVSLETPTLTAKAKVLQVEYESGENNSKSIFKKVALKIGVWEKE